MEKTYSSVLELVQDISNDKGFNNSFEELLKSKQIARTLFALRNKAKMSQQDVAEKMKCTQGKVSKIERTADLDLSIRDLVGYCSAVNMQLEIGFSDLKTEMVDRVKYHYFMLKSLLDEMRELASGDDAMEKGVETFTKEAFANVITGLFECVKNVSVKKSKASPLHVSNPINFNLEEKNQINEAIV